MRRSATVPACGLGLLLSTAAYASPTPDDRLTVHEWGTFTALQDESGRSVSGVNTDDEPVPGFVHDLHELIQGPTQLPPLYEKGYPRTSGDVYVRLETPVMYFYPPAGLNHPVNVEVAFHGGWLTQFYPNAQTPGLKPRSKPAALNDATVGKLIWPDVQIGTHHGGPDTSDHVWLAPRQVQSAEVTTGGESEKYLFYRGVGHINAPLRVSRAEGGVAVEIHGQFGSWAHPADGYPIGPLWLVDVREDGTYAVRYVERINLPASDKQTGPHIPATFSPGDYNQDLQALRSTMHAALVRNGLFEDEAEAMLNTWEVSYFRRPGLRLFYVVPREWTDHVLSLKLSEPADINRVMVGRIELVTPHQRDLLAAIARGPVSDPDWLGQAMEKYAQTKDDAYREEWYKSLNSGKRALMTEPIQIPADYRSYLGLGRFRNALILDEEARHGNANLRRFIKAYGLERGRVDQD